MEAAENTTPKWDRETIIVRVAAAVFVLWLITWVTAFFVEALEKSWALVTIIGFLLLLVFFASENRKF